MEAKGLVAKDNMMGGMVKGKSDPYAKISVGEVPFKSSVIKENLNPVWNEMYEVCRWGCTNWISLSMTVIKTGFLVCLNICVLPQVVLRPQSGQQIQVEVYDKDMDKDDFLGR